jgi:hypothetical protein
VLSILMSVHRWHHFRFIFQCSSVRPWAGHSLLPRPAESFLGATGDMFGGHFASFVGFLSSVSVTGYPEHAESFSEAS